MTLFEVHITGEQGINEELTAMDIKNITIDLLYPDFSVFRREYMSSLASKFRDLQDCKDMVDAIVSKLKSKIIRVKIETPYSKEFVESSIYLETHFIHKQGYGFPLSKNVVSGKILGTDRTYNKDFYTTMIESWKGEAEIELCLYDDYIREDFDWFKLFKNNNMKTQKLK